MTNAQIIEDIAAQFAFDRHRLLDIVRAVQARLGYISDDSAREIARSLNMRFVEVVDMISFYSFVHRRPRGRWVIRLSECVAGKMRGLKQVAEALERAAGTSFGRTSPDGLVSLEYTSCIGMCDQAPAALINGSVVTNLQPDAMPALIASLRAAAGQAGGSCATTVESHVRRRGPVVFAPMERGRALRSALNKDPGAVIDEINRSRVRGRGGAGFPLGMKWGFCRKAHGSAHYVVANADEGEPGTFKDRAILTENPDLLFEGMTLAGYALGAVEGFVYLRAEYEYLLEGLQQCLEKRRRTGLLGENICGREGFRFDIRIQPGAGAYICGEESALIESAEGKRGAPRDRPPYPVQKGYLGQPTAVNNVETFCCAARILDLGADWFLQMGTKDSTGTKLLSISGDCREAGVYEVGYGITVQEILEMVGAEDAQAVQVGGPSGQCLAPKDFGRRISFEDVPTGGAVMIFGPQRDLLDHMHDFTRFFVHESCGWCNPCRLGTTLLLMKLEKILDGNAESADLKEIEELGITVRDMSRCGLGQSSANPILVTLRNFPHLYYQRVRPQPFSTGFNLNAALKEGRIIRGENAG